MEKISERVGIATVTGYSIFDWLASQRDPSKHSTVQKHNEMVRKMAQSLRNADAYKKVRTSQVSRTFSGAKGVPGFDALAFHPTSGRTPTADWRGPNNKFQISLPRPTEVNSSYLSQFKVILEDIGLCGHTNQARHFAFKDVRNRVRNYLKDEDLESEQDPVTGEPVSVSGAGMRLATALSVANAIEGAPRWEPVNILRKSSMKRSLTDINNQEQVSTQVDHIRFLADKDSYPDYAKYGFVDRQGNPLYDPETHQWRRIRTGTEAEKMVDHLYEELEIVSNGAEDNFGRGFAFVPVILEPLTMHTEVLEKLQGGGTPQGLPLTEDEAAYNEAIQLINWQNKFPNRQIGEIKFIDQPMTIDEEETDENGKVISSSKLAYKVRFYVFSYQNTDESRWGEVVADSKGRTLRREGDDPTARFVEDFSYFGGRDEIDHDNRKLLRKPQVMNEFGTGFCALYTILTPKDNYHTLTELMPQFLIQMVNWNIDFSTGAENQVTINGKVAPRYSFDKFDLLNVLFPFELYGPGTNALGTQKRVRMISQIRFTDRAVAMGLKSAPTHVEIPAVWAKGEQNYDILVPNNKKAGQRGVIGLVRDVETGLWSHNYTAPLDVLFRKRHRKAREARKGFRLKKNGRRVCMNPRVYGRDRDLMHVIEWYFRWADQVNQITEAQREGDDIQDSNYYQSWDKPLLSIDFEDVDDPWYQGEYEGTPIIELDLDCPPITVYLNPRAKTDTARQQDTDVCFESGHYFTFTPRKKKTSSASDAGGSRMASGSILADNAVRLQLRGLVGSIESQMDGPMHALTPDTRKAVIGLVSSQLGRSQDEVSNKKDRMLLNLLGQVVLKVKAATRLSGEAAELDAQLNVLNDLFARYR